MCSLLVFFEENVFALGKVNSKQLSANRANRVTLKVSTSASVSSETKTKLLAPSAAYRGETTVYNPR